jgi:hypothetical protein
MKTTLPPSWYHLLLYLLEIAIILLLVPGFLNFVALGQEAIAFPFPIDYGEGPLLDQTMRLARFENIYRADLTTPPFTIANYPPLFVLSQVPFAWVFGPALWYGRLISCLGACIAGIMLGLLVYTLTKDFLAALIGGFTLFAIPYVLVWAPLNRVDPLALGLSLAGLLTITRWSVKRWGLVLSAVLLVAAVYTRQSYGLAAPLAAFVWLFSHHPRKRAFTLTAWVAGLGLGLFLVLNLLTRGGFYLNVITANANAFQWDTVSYYAGEIKELLPILLAVNLVFISLGWFRNKSWSFFLAYLVGASLSAVTVGKVGSNVNYLLEFCAALSLGVGLCLAWLGATPKPRSSGTSQVVFPPEGNHQSFPNRASTPIETHPIHKNTTHRGTIGSITRLGLISLFLICLAAQFVYLRNPRIGFYDFMIGKMDNAPNFRTILSWLENVDGPILADEDMALIPLLGKSLQFQPFEFSQLSYDGTWDQTPFLEAIHHQEYAAILQYDQWGMVAGRWTPEMIAAIEANYRPVRVSGPRVLYFPR